MSSRKQLFLLLILIASFSSCYYDVGEEIYGIVQCESIDMSFKNDIQPIIENNCYNGCHNGGNPSSGFSLESYEGVKIKVDQERLLGAINRDDGFTPMPQNLPKLIDCNIEKIENWIDEGALDN